MSKPDAEGQVRVIYETSMTLYVSVCMFINGYYYIIYTFVNENRVCRLNLDLKHVVKQVGNSAYCK